MTGIQIILITGALFIAIYFFLRLRNRVLDVMLLSLFVIIAVVFILQPELTNRLANWLGVGRGADLIFYISIIAFWFVILKMYIKVRKLEQDFTKIIRDNAIKEAKEKTG